QEVYGLIPLVLFVQAYSYTKKCFIIHNIELYGLSIIFYGQLELLYLFISSSLTEIYLGAGPFKLLCLPVCLHGLCKLVQPHIGVSHIEISRSKSFINQCGIPIGLHRFFILF